MSVVREVISVAVASDSLHNKKIRMTIRCPTMGVCAYTTCNFGDVSYSNYC